MSRFRSCDRLQKPVHPRLACRRLRLGPASRTQVGQVTVVSCYPDPVIQDVRQRRRPTLISPSTSASMRIWSTIFMGARRYRRVELHRLGMKSAMVIQLTPETSPPPKTRPTSSPRPTAGATPPRASRADHGSHNPASYVLSLQYDGSPQASAGRGP